MTKRRNFTPEFKAEVVLEALSGETSQAELCRRHNLSEQQLSKWKQQVVENVATLFVSSTDQQSSEAAERIAHLEQLVGRLTVALDIEKKARNVVELTSSEKREMVETVRNTSSYSVRQICQTLGFNRSLVYSHSKSDPSQRELREKIEALCLEYPKYGYRRIKALLLRQGYTVGTRRVARLMKEANLSVAVKRACQTTHSMERRQPWQNRLKTLDICRCDQVWVGDITYVRLKGRFIYVALLMDVFTRMIRRVAAESALDANSDLETLRASVSRERSGDTSLRSRHTVSFKCLSLNSQASWY